VTAQPALVVLWIKTLDQIEIGFGGTHHRTDIDLAGRLHQAHAAPPSDAWFQQALG
jgi:hypothetical protein